MRVGPAGIEPTSSCFAGSRRTVWLQRHECPCQELNLIFDLRGVACESGTPQGPESTPPRNRTSSDRFDVCHAVHHTRRAFVISVARPGIEPGPTASEADMLSGTPTGHVVKYPDLESNQDQDLRRVLCCPLHHRDVRADDWICTSITPLTRRMPFSVEPRRQ